MPRDPDTTFTTEGESRFGFDDITERYALKMTSLARMGAPVNWALFQKEVMPPHLRLKKGLAAIVYRQELEITDTPLQIQTPLKVLVKLQLGKNGEGEDTRIIARSDVEVLGTPMGGGELVSAGRMMIDHVFTRLTAPPPERRVRAFDPEMDFSAPTPAREFDYLAPQALLDPPAGYEPLGEAVCDGEPHVWPYGNTDPNLHIHMMDYVGFGATFATDQFARLGKPATDYFFNRCSVVYRRPFFTGDPYHRRGRAFTLDGGAPTDLALCGAYYRTEGAPPEGEKPAVAFRFLTAAKPHGGIIPGK
ncbi:MAG: hypothetical protein KDH09_01530 [Chrysiogenetes bacterium]|nr:hypothetical protein [Chrysiogenetes bacterium]